MTEPESGGMTTDSQSPGSLSPERESRECKTCSGTGTSILEGSDGDGGIGGECPDCDSTGFAPESGGMARARQERATELRAIAGRDEALPRDTLILLAALDASRKLLDAERNEKEQHRGFARSWRKQYDAERKARVEADRWNSQHRKQEKAFEDIAAQKEREADKWARQKDEAVSDLENLQGHCDLLEQSETNLEARTVRLQSDLDAARRELEEIKKERDVAREEVQP